MGVDWIPCRVEAGYQTDELCELVRREALHFRTSDFSMATIIDPRIQFPDTERERIRQAYLEPGPLYPKLLFKQESHRVSVISSEELYPIEWRIDAERTILPSELGEQLAEWQNYREEVKKGGHRPFLQNLYVYVRLHELVTVDLANLISVMQQSRATTGSWATRPEVVACRDQLLGEPLLTLPPPPRWPAGDYQSDLSLVEQGFARVESAVVAWNHVVQRGNARLRLPRRPPAFEDWITLRINDPWYASFLAWVEPWERGGYGLYRDCE